MIPTSERYKYAKNQFLASNPLLQAKLDNLNPVHAENIGIEISEYRQHELDKAFSSYAESIGTDVHELVIEICAKNDDEKKQMLIEHHKSVAEAIGVEWSEYLSLNNLSKIE